MNMKKLTNAIFIMLFISCSNVKFVLNDEPINSKDELTKSYLKKMLADNKTTSIIYFTSGFVGDTISLISQKKLIFSLPLETIPQLSLAHVKVIENKSDILIKVLSKKQVDINLDSTHLRDYKFVYISKKNYNCNKFIVEFSNIKKDFY